MSQASCRRRGLSLVETLVVMTVGAVVLGGVVVGATSLLRANSRLLTAEDESRLLLRLGDVLRRDVHAAQHAQWDANAATLKLTLRDDSTIQYTLTNRRCDRTVGEDTTPWRVPDGVAMTCDPPSASAPALFEVTLGSEVDAWPVRLVAVLGLDPVGANSEEAPQ